MIKLTTLCCVCLMLGLGCSTARTREGEPWGGDKAKPPRDLFSNPDPTKPPQRLEWTDFGRKERN